MKLRVLCLALLLAASNQAVAIEAKDLVRQAIDNWRGVSSVGTMRMTISRPDWQRSMTMDAWTEGTDNSLVRVTEPRRDRGNATLMLNDSMWNFSPKVNRVIKIPSSMMGQSWMGSDFSNKDVSRSDDIVDQYTHSLLSEEELDGFVVYTIESVPKEDAAVVWGREVLRIRSDFIVLTHEFYDQDDVLLRKLNTLDIGAMGGRTIALRQRMHSLETPDEWTELEVLDMRYDVDLDARLFTLSNLRNPRN